jgi:hypothetical protein
MATITEDYVTLETAKLLKEKGFECNYKEVLNLLKYLKIVTKPSCGIIVN